MAVPHQSRACAYTDVTQQETWPRDDSECPVLNGFSQANVYHDGELPGSALLHERPKHLHYGDNGHHRGWILNGELTPMHIAQGTREIGASQQHLPPGLTGRCTAVNTH